MNEKNISKYLRLYPINLESKCLRIHYRNIENLDFNTELPNITGNYKFLNFITEFSINHNKVEVLDGLRYFPNLKIFSFAYNRVRDLNTLFNSIINPEIMISITYTGNYVEEDLDIDNKLKAFFPNLKEINGESIYSEDSSKNDWEEDEYKYQTDDKNNYKYYSDNSMTKDVQQYHRQNNSLCQVQSFKGIYNENNQQLRRSR